MNSFRRTILIFTILICFSLTNANAQNPQDIIITHAEWKPFIYLENGKTRGMFVEVAKLIFEDELKIGLKFQSRPWKRAQAEVQQGTADMLLTVPTKKRNQYTIKSDSPFYQFFINVYTYKGHKKLDYINKIKTADDIKNLSLIPVTNLGNGWHKQNIDDHGVKTYYVPQDENIALVLANKRADLTLDSAVSMNYIIKLNNLTDKLVLTDAKFGPIDFHILMSKKSKFIKRMPEINEALNKLKENGKIDAIIEKYTALK